MLAAPINLDIAEFGYNGLVCQSLEVCYSEILLYRESFSLFHILEMQNFKLPNKIIMGIASFPGENMAALLIIHSLVWSWHFRSELIRPHFKN